MGRKLKHYVLLCRPRFEVAVIEIDAEEHRAAEVAALEKVSLGFKGWRLVPFDSREYRPHVEQCMSESDIEIDAEIAPEVDVLAEARAVKRDEYTRYALVMADIFDGEGKVLPQPWMFELPPMLEHDLCDDWITDLKGVKARALKSAKEGAERPQPPASVVPFRRTGKDEEPR